MTDHRELAALLPLRSAPYAQTTLSAAVVLLSVAGPVGLLLSGGVAQDDLLGMLLGVPVFALFGVYGLYRAWQSWTVLTLEGDELIWRGRGQTHRFSPDAVAHVLVDHGDARRRMFHPAHLFLQLRGEELPDAVQIGQYRLIGSGLLQHTYRLAAALGVQVDDPTGHLHRTQYPLPMRWLGEGRDWMLFVMAFAVSWPVVSLLFGNMTVAVVALASALLVIGVTLAAGYRPLDLEE